MIMQVALCMAGGMLFLVSIGAYMWVKLRMKPDGELDEYYIEFEDQHPGYARYERWSRITFAGAVAGALMLFLGVVI